MRTQPPAWAAPFIGIPFVARGRARGGCDCWGFIRIVLAEQFHVHVPEYREIGWFEGGDTRALAAFMEIEKRVWVQVAARAEAPGDVLLIRQAGQPFHVGIVAVPGLMLHSLEGAGSACDEYRGAPWRFTLPGGKTINHIEGFYRHALLAGR